MIWQKYDGLDEVEVETRIAKGQVNSIGKKNTRSNFSIIVRHVFELPNIIIFTGVIFLIFYEQFGDALMISGIICTNMLISIYQELQAKASLQKVRVINSTKAQVIRNGELQEIDQEKIVKDDHLYANSGHYLPVDGKVLTAKGLLIDESILTGESDYLVKKKGDKLMSGSFVVAGEVVYKAEKVGPESFVNKMTTAARKYIHYLSPLQVYINKIVQGMTVVTIVVIALLLSLNIISESMNRIALLDAVISIVTAMIPQGIVMTLTLAFMVGVIRMYQKKILVQRASSIETLASVKVLCMDKTGTLTENKLHLSEWQNLTEQDDEHILKNMCDYAHLTQEKNKTINALATFCDTNGAEHVSVEAISQIPFTPKHKFSGLEFEEQGEIMRFLFGSPEILIKQCNLSEEQQNYILQQKKKYADQGLRVLLLLRASAKSPSKGGIVEISDWADSEFQPLALLGFEDKLRNGAQGIIQSFLDRNVKPVIISGDSADTLRALLKQLQLPALNKVITGRQLAAIDNDIDFKEAVISHDVFARVAPEQKSQIVEAYQDIFGRVAMLGDGVNDALAIKQANLGVAMASGANVTKNIADVILLDDDLAKLADVIQEGKEILFNTLRSAQLLLIKNAYSVVIIVTAILLGFSFPFAPRSLFLLAFFNASIPVFVILADKNIRLGKIRFLSSLLDFVLIGGGLASALAIFLLAYANGRWSVLETQTVIFVYLCLTGIVNSLIVMNKSYQLRKMFFGSWRSIIGFLTLIAIISVIETEFIRRIFELGDMNASQWLIVSGLGVGYLLVFSALGRIGLEKIVPKELQRKLLSRTEA